MTRTATDKRLARLARPGCGLCDAERPGQVLVVDELLPSYVACACVRERRGLGWLVALLNAEVRREEALLRDAEKALVRRQRRRSVGHAVATVVIVGLFVGWTAFWVLRGLP